MPSDQLREPFGTLRYQTAQMVADGFLPPFLDLGKWPATLFSRLAMCGHTPFVRHDQAAHIGKTAGQRLDGKYLGKTPLVPTVATLLAYAGKRGEPPAATRLASANALG